MSLTITIPGAVNVTTGSTAPAVLTIGVGVPGAQGPAGPGVPAGGTAGQYLQKIDGVDYNTDWVTLNLSSYLTTASAAATYQTIAGMSSYLTTSAAASTYYPLSGNPSGFLTSSALTGYATESWVSSGFATTARGLPSSGTIGQVLTKNSGTDYDASWATLIPGDRYLTTSSTSNTIGNGTKTFTVGTGLSYTTQQDIVIAYDASNHMHALVTSYNSGTGVMVVDVKSHTGSGTYTAWTVNVGGTTPLQTVEWGEILGTLGDQTDLATALNAKLESSTAASTYAALAGATFTGEVITPASTTSNAGLTITPGTAPTTPTNGEIWATTSDLQVRLNGVTETIAEQSWVTSQGYITSSALTPYAPLAGATFTGRVGTVASTTTTAGLNIPHGAAPTTPVNGDVWTTTSGLFARINGGTQQYAPLGSNNTFSNASSTYGSSTATGTIGLATGATISGSTKTVNIGTAGVAGSTTNITAGPVLGASTITIGATTAASTLNLATGATLTATTKAVNIGTAGVAGSTTNIAIGSTTGTSTTTLQGTTNGVTLAADTNTTALATTAFVVGQAGSASPVMDGAATVGTSLRYARQDHVHPTDTSRAPLASPALTGTPTAPTATTGTNTTQIATTAFVQQEVPDFATTAEIMSPSSTTKVLSPFDGVRMITNRAFFDTMAATGSFNTSGTGAEAYKVTNDRLLALGTPNAGIAGHGQHMFDTTASSWGLLAAKRGAFQYTQDWSKKIFASGTAMFNLIGDSATTARVMIGGKAAFGTGSPTKQSIGWKLVGGGSNALVLVTYGYDGTSTVVTETTSSFTPVVNQAFDWFLYHEPNVSTPSLSKCYLYVNDTLVATGINSPADATITFNYFLQGCESTGSHATRMAYYAFPTKIWWSRS